MLNNIRINSIGNSTLRRLSLILARSPKVPSSDGLAPFRGKSDRVRAEIPGFGIPLSSRRRDGY